MMWSLFFLTSFSSMASFNESYCKKVLQNPQFDQQMPASTLRDCLKANQDSHHLNYLAGLHFLSRKKAGKASKYFYRAAKLNGRIPHYSLYYLKARAISKAKAEELKKIAWTMAHRFKRKHELLAQMGNILMQNGYLLLAFEFFNHLVEKDFPQTWVFHLKLGQMFCFKKAWDSAIVQLQRSNELKPDQGLTLYYLGRAWEGKGNQRFALSFFKHAMRNGLQGEEADYVLARFYEWKRSSDK